MPRIKYHLVVAQGYPAIDAAAKLNAKVNSLMEAGWEPSMPPGMFGEEPTLYTAFQAMLSNPRPQTDITAKTYRTIAGLPAEEVTAGGHQERDPVTLNLGENYVFPRDTQAWKDAWAALTMAGFDIYLWMYISSKISNDGLSWDHSFKHIETRSYRTVTTPRQIQEG